MRLRTPPPRPRATRRPTTDTAGARSADRSGYDEGFLGIRLPLPSPAATDFGPADAAALVTLPYVHFSVVFNRQRRLAALTAVNIDGESLVDLERGDDWHLDDRLPARQQTGPAVYARNDLDRGHLVRRRDPVWGPDAAPANLDTFTYTNAAPQVNVFNQSKELWVGLEDYVLENARTNDARLSVFTGPVFDPSDPVYRDVQVPRMFFKVAAWSTATELACTAYLLDQGALLDDLDLPAARITELGAYRTFQVAVSEISRLTGLDLSQLEGADRYEPRPGARPTSWTRLTSFGDIRL